MKDRLYCGSEVVNSGSGFQNNQVVNVPGSVFVSVMVFAFVGLKVVRKSKQSGDAATKTMFPTESQQVA